MVQWEDRLEWEKKKGNTVYHFVLFLYYIPTEVPNYPSPMETVVMWPISFDLLRYPLAREGVYAPGGPAFLAHTKQKVSIIVGLTALRLAIFMGYE